MASGAASGAAIGAAAHMASGAASGAAAHMASGAASGAAAHMASGAASGAATGAGRQARRGPAPFASFDHDVSDESSPESKLTFQLPEIREDRAQSPGTAGASGASGAAGATGLAPPEQRARSASSPAVTVAPRIDISRASSSSHHDSRDSSPELALFAADDRARLELGFREDGALDLRSSTEELAFLEAEPAPPPAAPPPAPPPERRHSRKDSQCSEAALLAISGRTSRLSSVGSQCSARSDLSRVSKLSVASGVSRSPSPHRMLLETSFCGPKPIENDPELCADAAERRLLETISPTAASRPAPAPALALALACEIRTEATIEHVAGPPPAPLPLDTAGAKLSKESIDRPKAAERKSNRRRERRESGRISDGEPAAYGRSDRSRDIIRIKLKPDEEYEKDESDDDETSDRTLSRDPRRVPVTLDLAIEPEAPTSGTLEGGPGPSPTPSRRGAREDRGGGGTPSPGGGGGNASRKSSFCSLFKSRETIASPDSPSAARLRRKKSLDGGCSRSRSASRDRSATPASTNRIKGSVLSLFKTPKRGGSSTSPGSGSRDGSPVVPAQRHVRMRVDVPEHCEKLKYYEESKDGIIHIPLHTPPDERPRVDDDGGRPAEASSRRPAEPVRRTVLPDGSVIIPLRSPTEDGVGRAPLVDDLDMIKSEEFLNFETKASTTESSSARIESERPIANTIVLEDGGRSRRKERAVFTTNVGSEERPFTTQFSITKTPSSDFVSESFPSFRERPTEIETQTKCDETVARDAGVKTAESPARRASPSWDERTIHGDPKGISNETKRDTSRSGTPAAEQGSRDAVDAKSDDDSRPNSSESELGSEAGPFDKNAPRDPIAEGVPAEEAEKRSLVVTQESFEEELPYVPTTLPLERSLALPMVPVRDRGTAAGRTRPVDRPRSTTPIHPAALEEYLSDEPRTPDTDKLRIRLPRPPADRRGSRAAPRPRPWGEFAERALPGPAPPRQRPATAPPRRPSAPAPSKPSWIDFEEVPERRKQPRRIQTVPRERESEPTYSYVEPDECRCECHHTAPPAPPDDELPLLKERRRAPLHPSDSFMSDSSLEYSYVETGGGSESGGAGAGAGGELQLSLHVGTPFTCDLDLRSNRSSYADQVRTE